MEMEGKELSRERTLHGRTPDPHAKYYGPGGAAQPVFEAARHGKPAFT